MDRGRRRVARIYDRLLAGSGILTPAAPAGDEHVYHVYAIRSAMRDRLADGLAAAGVATGMHYPRPVHLQPAYADLGYREGDFPVAGELSRGRCSPCRSIPNSPKRSSSMSAARSSDFMRISMSPSADLPTVASSLAGARCLVTGGAGFVGSQTVDRLLDAGCAEVLILDNMVRGRRETCAAASAQPPAAGRRRHPATCACSMAWSPAAISSFTRPPCASRNARRNRAPPSR